MQQTSNYQLSQWDAEDRIQRTDFNSDNAKVDAALAAQAAAVNSVVAKMGNCRIVTTTYAGTGTYGSGNPCTLTFDASPALVLVMSPDGHALFMHSNSTSASYESVIIPVTWSGTSVSWYANGNSTNQFNASGKVYRVCAFFVME